MRGPERAGLTSLPAGPPPSGAAFPAPSGAGSGGAAEPSAAGLGAQSRDAGCSARCLAAPESSHRPAARLVASLSRSPRLQPLRPPVPRGRKSLPPPPPRPRPLRALLCGGGPRRLRGVGRCPRPLSAPSSPLAESAGGGAARLPRRGGLSLRPRRKRFRKRPSARLGVPAPQVLPRDRLPAGWC